MRTPNERTMIKAAVVCLTLVAVGGCSDLGLSGSQDVFAAGASYKIETILGSLIDFRVIEAPDDRGWVLVEILSAPSDFPDFQEGEVLLNTSSALFAKRIDSESVE